MSTILRVRYEGDVCDRYWEESIKVTVSYI
jgi:hypothetical protein